MARGRGWAWARRELAQLDPVADAQRAAHLSFEVRYGTPIFVDALFSVAFARQVAVPAIAEVLYRDGRGIILSDTAKRNRDTLVFFGLLYRDLNTPAGDAVINRIRALHARFHIPNDLNLYTLATLSCLPGRISEQFLSKQVLSDTEITAQYTFWHQVGTQMGITGIPPSPEEFLAWMIDYEVREFAHTKAGVEVTLALAREFGRRWFPEPLRGWGERLFLALMDEPLRQTHRIAPASGFKAGLIRIAVRSYFFAKRLLPDPAERTLVETFGQEYGRQAVPSAVGPQSASSDQTPL